MATSMTSRGIFKHIIEDLAFPTTFRSSQIEGHENVPESGEEAKASKGGSSLSCSTQGCSPSSDKSDIMQQQTDTTAPSSETECVGLDGQAVNAEPREVCPLPNCSVMWRLAVDKKE